MEGAPLELVEGHIHQAWTRDFTCLVEVWPTPRAGFWHVWLRGPQSHATKEPLPSDLVPELLEEWGFSAEEWRNWRVNPQPTMELTRRVQVNERFSKAIEQLGQGGEDKVDVRIGAIYSLEQILSEMAETQGRITLSCAPPGARPVEGRGLGRPRSKGPLGPRSYAAPIHRADSD